MAEHRDADIAGWLGVIDQFDHAVAAQSSLDELVQLAGDMTGFIAGVRDRHNRIHVEATNGRLRVDETAGIDIAQLAAAQRLRGPRATAVETDNGPALVSPIDLASRRLGVAWLLATAGRAWEPTDYLVVERLAGAAGARILNARKPRANGVSFDPSAVERLLSGGLPSDELDKAARHAKLSPSDHYVAIALEPDPPHAIELDALALLGEKTIADQGLAARGTVIGACAAVIARAGEALAPVLLELAEGERRAEFTIRIGVGDVTQLDQLEGSWRHAREALTLRDLVARYDRPAYFDDLGALHLLAQVPRESVQCSRLFDLLNDPAHLSGSPSDLDVLEAYLDTGTLRRAGERVFLHHTTVRHRLKGLEDRFDLDLGQPLTRFRLQLALRLLAIERARERAASLHP